MLTKSPPTGPGAVSRGVDPLPLGTRRGASRSIAVRAMPARPRAAPAEPRLSAAGRAPPARRAGSRDPTGPRHRDGMRGRGQPGSSGHPSMGTPLVQRRHGGSDNRRIAAGRRKCNGESAAQQGGRALRSGAAPARIRRPARVTPRELSAWPRASRPSTPPATGRAVPVRHGSRDGATDLVAAASRLVARSALADARAGRGSPIVDPAPPASAERTQFSTQRTPSTPAAMSG